MPEFMETKNSIWLLTDRIIGTSIPHIF